MSPTSIGDLAQSFVNRRANQRLTAELNRLGTELATGLRSDPGTATSGDAGPVAAIERQLTTLAAYRTATAEAALFTAAAQSAMGKVATGLSNLVAVVLAARGSTDPLLTQTVAQSGADAFAAAVATFNTTVADRSLFAGAGTAGPALADAATLRADLSATLAGAATATEVSDRIDAYFAPGGGFDMTGYAGADADLAPFRLSSGDSAGMDVRADDPENRAALAALAKVAVLDGPVLTGDAAGRAALLSMAGDDLLAAESGITALRARIGATEARIEGAATGNAAERTALQQARADLRGADPYETAARLEQTQAQLESLYTVTARLSRLSLTNYL